MFGHKAEGDALLGGRSLVVSVDEDIGVEEATCAHESRRS